MFSHPPGCKTLSTRATGRAQKGLAARSAQRAEVVSRGVECTIGIRNGRLRQARSAGGTPKAESELETPSAMNGAITGT